MEKIVETTFGLKTRKVEQMITRDGHRITLVNLINPQYIKLYSSGLEEATKELESLNPEKVNALDGEFALAYCARDERGRNIIVAARTIGVPARIACQVLSSEHTRVIFAHTIREIAYQWKRDLPQGVNSEDLKDFDPMYTEMLPAFYIVVIKPWAMRDRQYIWFLDTPEHSRPHEGNLLPDNVLDIGIAYIKAAQKEIYKALNNIPQGAEIGVTLSGGIDSSTIALLLIDAVKTIGSNHKIKFFTLSLGENGIDLNHARRFIECLDEKYRNSWEPVIISPDSIDVEALRVEACKIAEEYHVRDLEGAMAGFTLLGAVRKGYPNLKYIFDGDGGNEAFQDYPLEDEGYGRITLNDIWDDPHLFYLGYHRKKLAFNPVFSGGLSRAYVRTFNPARHYGFIGFSPFISRNVLKIAQRFPLKMLAPNVELLHTLRGRAIKAAIAKIFRIDIPAFEKVRFQEGVVPEEMGRHSPFRITQEQSMECKNFLLRGLFNSL